MKILRTFMILIPLVFFLSSCEYEWIQPEKVPVPDELSFSTDIMPIFNNGCNTNVCHGAGGTPPDLSEGNAYSSLINEGFVDVDLPEASMLYTCMLTGGSMAPYVQRPGDADIILAWIQQGANNN